MFATPVMKALLQRWVGWSLCLLVLALPGSALAAGFEDALTGVASDDRDRLEAAISAVLADGLRTGDIGEANRKTVGTEEMGAAILKKLSA